MAVMSSLSTAIKVLLLIALAFDVVKPQPSHLSGPDDMYVFKDNVVELTCQASSTTEYAIVWHSVDGNGKGTIVGWCFFCPTQEKCSVREDMKDDFNVSKEGDSYILTILKPQIPKTASFGHIQCGYQEVQNCDSDPTTTGRFYLFQSAIVYVYDFPSCRTAVTTLNGSYFQDLTCTLTPGFYDDTEEVGVELTFNDARVQPDVKLPHGIVKRNISSSLQELNEVTKIAECTVVLAGKLNRSCNFALPGQENVTVLISPLNASIRAAGKGQKFYCHVTPNATMERSWAIFEEGGSYKHIPTSTRSAAGDVIFFTDIKESVILTNPHTEGTHYFIECTVVTTDGRKVSAFASVKTLGAESTQIIQQTTHTTIIQSTSEKLESTPTSSMAKSDNMVGILIFIIVPIVLIIVFFVIGFAIVWKRTRKRSFKQPPRKMEVNYSNMGSNDNMVMDVGNDGEGRQKHGEFNQVAD